MAKSLAHIALSMLLIAATAGVTISKHYCSGEVVRIAVNTHADNCCDDNSSCDHCSTENELIKTTEEFVASSIINNIDIPVEAITITFNNIDLLNATEAQAEVFFNADSPPLFKRDIPVLISQFLL